MRFVRWSGFFLPVVCSALWATDLQVIAKTPYGRTESATAVSAITATFNQPMVPLDTPEAMGHFCPIEFTPPLKGRCRWQGTQVLSFEPESRLPIATTFKVTIPAGTTSKVSGAVLSETQAWDFETMRPQIASSKPTDNDKWVDLKAPMFVLFTLDMDWKRAAPFITLEGVPLNGGPAKKIDIALRQAKADDIKQAWPYGFYGWNYQIQPSTANVLVIKPSRALEPDHVYHLKFAEGLLAAQGPLGLISPRTVNFETWYTFRFMQAPIKECLPAYFQVAFSNPIRVQDLMEHWHIASTTSTPFNPEHRQAMGQLDPPQRRVLFSVPMMEYKPAESYAMTVDADVKDIFGNRLGTPATFTLETGDYCPSLTMPEGWSVIESYLPPRHAVDVLNTAQVPLEMARIPDEELIPFYENFFRARDKLNLNSPLIKTWTPKVGRNHRWRTYLDLNQVLQSHGGFVASQLFGPSYHHEQDRWFKSLDNVTRIGLTLKSSPDSTLVWTSFLRSGSPAPHLPVEIRSEDNRVLWAGVSDAQGFVDAPGWKKLGLTWAGYQRPKLWVFAKDAKGTAALSTDQRQGIEPWRFNVPYDWAPKVETYRGSLFTERGVYRPGETVYLKGMVRKLVDGDWTASDINVVRLTIHDARNVEVVKTTITLSGQSSFDFAYAVRDSAPTGFWRATVTEVTKEDSALVRDVTPQEEEEEISYEGRGTKLNLKESFRVEAFKPASFEVHVTPAQPSFMSGQDFKAVVDGWYLFGAPMAEAPVEWKLRLEPGHFVPEGFEEFDFSSGWWNTSGEGGRLVASENVKLDAKGKYSVTAKLDAATAHSPRTAVLEASITSPDRQRLFGRTTVTVHSANLYLGIRPGKYFVNVGDQFQPQVIAVHPDGTRVLGTSVQAELIRHEWLSVQRSGISGRLEWVNEERNTTVSSFTYTTGRDTFTWTTKIEHPGQYYFKVTGQDENNRSAESAISFYAFGPGASWWSQNDTDLIELLPEKKNYKPGDTARILVKSPYPHSRALVTLEREGVLARWLTTVDGAGFINVPLTEKHLPNVFVGVMLVQGRIGQDKYSETGEDIAKPEAKFGYTTLSVSPAGRHLKVNVTTDKTNYRPRARVSVTVRTLNESGEPAPAEVTVYTVDEGVLSLTGYGTPDPYHDFYGPRALQVDTADSRSHILGQRSYGEKGENRGGGGGGKPGLEGIDLRSRFVPTAYWNPTVKTNAQGLAQVSFELPDNLSRFRVMAVASAGKRFGAGESQLTVAKPLLLRPSLPRFARVGDTFQGGVVIHNYSTQVATGTLVLTLAGHAFEVQGALQKSFIVDAGKALEILWTCKAVALGKTAFQFRAATGKETDGLEWNVPVKTVERLETVATSGVTEQEALEALNLPKDVLRHVGQLQITLSATALAGLEEGARYLLDYPYGCLEQRMSRSLPVIVGAELVDVFKLGTLGTLKNDVQKQFYDLATYQHPSGGFGYWPNPWSPDPYLTSYTLEVAWLGKKEGYSLPEEVIRKATAWLQIYLSSRQQWAYPYSQNEDYAARAYALYVLGLYHEAPGNYFMPLYERRDQLPYLAKAYLAKAAPLVMNDPKIRKTLASELLNQSRLSPTTMHFEEPAETRMPWIHESTVKTTAVVLQALLEAERGFSGDEKVVRWLMQERKDKGRWRTTQENADSLRVLQDYYRRYESEDPSFTATVSHEGEKEALWSQRFQGRSLAAPLKEISLESVFGSADKIKLRLAKEGTGRLYYTLRMAYAPTHFDQAASEGFTIEKTIHPLNFSTPTSGMTAGRRMVVTLKVKTTQDRPFVALEDPLPGGFEIVDPSFAVEGQEDARMLEGQSKGNPYWGGFQRSEKYDDRIVIFADFLATGEHTYSYLVQATTPGEFHSPATFIEQMYEPEVFGRTASGHVSIQ